MLKKLTVPSLVLALSGCAGQVVEDSNPSVPEGSETAHLNYLKEIYRETVKKGFLQGKVIFVNSQKFDGTYAENIEAIKNSIEEQSIDEKLFDLAHLNNIKRLEDLVRLSKENPWAIPIEGRVCIVSEPDENFLTKEKIISFLSGVAEHQLNPIPGRIEDYIKYIGGHEGGHCADASLNMTGGDTLRREIFSDEKGAEAVCKMDGTPKVVDGTPKVVDMLLDQGCSPVASIAIKTIEMGRVLAAHYDPDHATQIPSQNLGGMKVDYQQRFNFAKIYKYGLYGIVAKKIGLDNIRQARYIYKNNPELFFDVVDVLVEQGAFDESKQLKSVVQDLSKAERALKNFDAVGDRDDLNLEVEVIAVQFLGDKKWVQQVGSKIERPLFQQNGP